MKIDAGNIAFVQHQTYVRSITCWTLSRYANWIANMPTLIEPVTTKVCLCCAVLCASSLLRCAPAWMTFSFSGLLRRHRSREDRV